MSNLGLGLVIGIVEGIVFSIINVVICWKFRERKKKSGWIEVN